MPGPPPPSASYLLDINTDSEASDDDDEAHHDEEKQQQQDEDSNKPAFPDSSSPSSNKQQNDSPSKKKKKKRKRRKKKKSTKKQVSFGGVSVREYERCLGVNGVPLDGGWPLGISPTVVKEYQAASSIDEFEQRRQEELRERYAQVMNQYTTESSTCGSASDDDKTASPLKEKSPPDEYTYLETRQYDYRKRLHEITQSTKNPLFGPLQEEDRMRLLVRNDSTSSLGEQDDDSISTTASSSSSSMPNSPFRRNRTRSNSMGNSNDNSHTSNRRMATRRTRANSEQFIYSEQYTSTQVMHVRNELEQVRIHRTLEGSTGCTCRKLDVYLPPPDGGGGKKAQHRRMKPQKVIEELRKRGKLPSNNKHSRAELEQLLHDVVEQEPCCWGEDCSCRRNGIGCQADACSCWLESHQRKGHNNKSLQDDDPTVKDIRERCGNNMYAVDLDGIHDFRLQFCQVIETNACAHSGDESE